MKFWIRLENIILIIEKSIKRRDSFFIDPNDIVIILDPRLRVYAILLTIVKPRRLEKRLKRFTEEGLRHEKGHFRKCPDFVICDPVRIRVILTKYFKISILHCRFFGAVTNRSLIGIDAVESSWTTICRVKIVTLSHSPMKDSKNIAYFRGRERTTIKIRNQIDSDCNS
jgi:hypothetical protein